MTLFKRIKTQDEFDAWMQQWLDALRSGNYNQTKEALCKKIGDTEYHCCLGVGSELIPGIHKAKLKNNPAFTFGCFEGGVNENRCFATGLPSASYWPWEFFPKFYQPADLNDEYELSFKQIADILEKHWKSGMFHPQAHRLSMPAKWIYKDGEYNAKV